MQVSRKLIITAVVTVLVAVGASLLLSYQLFYKRVAYVRSQELIFEYAGTQEAMLKFEEKKRQWQANVDTLQWSLQRDVDLYKQEYPDLTVDEHLKREEELHQQEKQLQNYAQTVQAKIQQADTEMMQGVINQINSFIEVYSKKNGYQLVIASNGEGNLLYGEDYLDITDDLLKALNQNYKGQ